jgi:cell division protein FtsL
MIHDYSERYFPAAGHKAPANRLFLQKRNSRQLPSGWLLWKSVGAALVIALAVGVTSSIWVGGKIRTALDDIAKSQTQYSALAEKNKRLLAQQDRLLSRERVEAAAKNLGLYPPTADQLRRP